MFRGYWQLFNQHGNLYLYGPDKKFSMEQKVSNDHGTFRLTTYLAGDLEIFTFGFYASDPKERPGHGGEWSSNSHAIRQVFGEDLKEIAYNGLACAIRIEDAKELAPQGVTYKGMSDIGFHEFSMNDSVYMEKIDLNGERMRPPEGRSTFPLTIGVEDPTR